MHVGDECPGAFLCLRRWQALAQMTQRAAQLDLLAQRIQCPDRRFVHPGYESSAAAVTCVCGKLDSSAPNMRVRKLSW